MSGILQALCPVKNSFLEIELVNFEISAFGGIFIGEDT